MMTLTFRFLLIATLISVSPTMGHARCEGAVMLTTFHNAYTIALTGGAQAQRQSARTLLVLAGGQTAEQIARHVAPSGAIIDVPRLSDVLEDARTFAKQTLSQNRTDDTDFRHGKNVEWLGEQVLSTNCKGSAASASLTPDRSPDARAMFRTVSYRSTEDGGWAVGPASIGLVTLLLAGIGAAYLFLRSNLMRKRKVERLPRFPIAMALELTFTTPAGEMQEAQGEALDISQGGLKLRWDEPPPTGTLATMTLLGIQRLSRVIWANQHYAGVMFEETLTKAELKSLTETHAPV